MGNAGSSIVLNLTDPSAKRMSNMNPKWNVIPGMLC